MTAIAPAIFVKAIASRWSWRTAAAAIVIAIIIVASETVHRMVLQLRPLPPPRSFRLPAASTTRNAMPSAAFRPATTSSSSHHRQPTPPPPSCSQHQGGIANATVAASGVHARIFGPPLMISRSSSNGRARAMMQVRARWGDLTECTAERLDGRCKNSQRRSRTSPIPSGSSRQPLRSRPRRHPPSVFGASARGLPAHFCSSGSVRAVRGRLGAPGWPCSPGLNAAACKMGRALGIHS